MEQVRDLRDNVRFAPTRGKFKIYYIDEVHMLSTAAFNALLKTLEEPPPGVKFVFCTTEPNKVPDTILSRCQRFDFNSINTQRIAERLTEIAAAEGVQVESDAIELVARRAAALESLSHDAVFADESSLDELEVQSGEDHDVAPLLTTRLSV